MSSLRNNLRFKSLWQQAVASGTALVSFTYTGIAAI